MILEALSRKSGEDAIECDGKCATWLHHQCAGLSKNAFDCLSESDNPFCCPHCRMDRQELELSSLRDVVTKLSLEIAALKDNLQGSITKVVPTASKSSVAAVSSSSSSSSSSSPEKIPVAQSQKVGSRYHSDSSDRMFNILIFSVNESIGSASNFARLNNDLEKSNAIISDIDSSFEAHSIRDHLCLGTMPGKIPR